MSKEILANKIIVTYQCPKMKINVDVEAKSLTITNQECDTCGQHGSVSYFVHNCPACKKYHDVILYSD